jgi:transposase
VDLAKNVFQVHAEDADGNQCVSRRLNRKNFKEFMRTLSPCVVGMEACGTSHYWGRELYAMGHQVKLINPRIVKAQVVRNKTDAKDAEAICDAARNKKVRCIAVKTLAQQYLSTIHRARSQLIKRRTQLVNHLRSQLAEYGLIANQGHASLNELTQKVLGGECLELSQESAFVFSDLYEEWLTLNKRILDYDAQIRRVAKENKTVRKLMTVPGIGPLTASALVAKVDDFSVFSKGKNFAAWLGLTPKEYSSANNRRLGGISKQGDRYVRTLLIHGARSAITTILKKDKQQNAYYRWIHNTVERVGKNKAVVALANKHARMLWALATHGRELDLNFSDSFI